MSDRSAAELPARSREDGHQTAANDAAPVQRMTGPACRLIGLDLLRGLAVMGMILVAYAGDWEHRFKVLTHADWRGFALADMIFPSFLFCVGAALPFSFRHRAAQGKAGMLRHVLWRSAALILLGIALQLLPAFDFTQLRLPGVLQRIGLCYAIVGGLCVLLGHEGKAGFTLPLAPLALAAVGVLLGYAALLLAWNAPGCGRACFDSALSLPAAVDRAVFGVHHLWPYGSTHGVVTYDPEGLVSTLGALFNVLAGVIASLFLQRQGVQHALGLLALAGGCALVIGLALDPVVPVVKKLWTPSFALLSSGFALLAFVILTWLAPQEARWTRPVLAFGSNATLAFVGISLIDTLMQLPLAGGGNAHGAAASLLGRVIPEPRIASAAYSVLLLLVLGVALWQLHRRRIFLKL